METVVSGIRSTGNLHLGNYFGAMKNFLKMQHEYRCFFFIADYHSLTTHPTPGNLKQTVRQVLAEYLACGIDPAKSVIFPQSAVSMHAELAWILECVARVGPNFDAAAVAQLIRQKLANKEVIYGFGHAVLRVEDPRARVLRKLGVRKIEVGTWHVGTRKGAESVKQREGVELDLGLLDPALVRDIPAKQEPDKKAILAALKDRAQRIEDARARDASPEEIAELESAEPARSFYIARGEEYVVIR